MAIFYVDCPLITHYLHNSDNAAEKLIKVEKNVANIKHRDI